MNIETIQAPRGAIAVLSGGKVQITDAGAALDLAMSVRYETARPGWPSTSAWCAATFSFSAPAWRETSCRS